MDWSEEEKLKFLDYFEKEPVLWDPRNKWNKNVSAVNDCWIKLSKIMKRPVTELKNKKNSFMATFRQHLRRKKKSIRSGAEGEDVYKPIWQYYDIMESFLGPIYLTDIDIESLKQEASDYNEHSVDTENYELGDDQNNGQHTEEENKKVGLEKRKTTTPIILKKQKRHKLHNFLDTDFSDSIWQQREKDECDLYAQLLSTKLLDYSLQERRQIMHGIDGYLLENPPAQWSLASPHVELPTSPMNSSPSSAHSS